MNSKIIRMFFLLIIIIFCEQIRADGLDNDCSYKDKYEIERYKRLKLDFTLKEHDLIQNLKKYLINVSIGDIKKWESGHLLEYKIFNNEKYYFKESIPNFFRLYKDNFNIKESPLPINKNTFPLNEHINKVIINILKENKFYVLPVTFKVKHTITVKKDVLPAGEVIRCWIPFPREISGRQINIKLLETEPKNYILASNKNLQRTIYFEKKSKKGELTTFYAEYQFTSFATYNDVNPSKIKKTKISEKLLPYLQEEPPHIIFSQDLKELSKKITGNEKNSFNIARKIFEWVYINIPWVSAREYSTIKNISQYALEYRHGDCGIKTMLFITLCRFNNIPARWQSGWEFQPPKSSMHDWCEIYLEPYGWIPVDVTYGVRNSNNDKVKWFYLTSLDSYRLVFNDDMSQEIYPIKTYFKSDSVDSQRGEVEWRGCNLYYNKWNYNFEWEMLDN